MKQFLGFAFISGMGWLCDFGTFTLLTAGLHVPEFVANFISSYVGVTFVWFTSLKTLFSHSGTARGRHLLMYWGYQFVSILLYSQLLHVVAATLQTCCGTRTVAVAAVGAKIIVTPLNLMTNFLFMKSLTRYLKRNPSQ